MVTPAVLDQHALDGRTVLLTGASGGIGAAIAGTLAAAGAAVAAHYRSDAAAAGAALAGVRDDRRRLIAGDLATPAGARALWRAAEQWQPVDVLVLNAAVIPDSPIDGPDEEWDAGWAAALAVNVIGTGALLREAVRAFAARGGGTAIVLSSWAAEQGSRIPTASAYAASKAAIRNLAQTLARHYVRDGVLIHVLAPGVVDAGMGVAGKSADQHRTSMEGLAMGRYVGAAELAELVAFLATGACASLTGATLDVNGASYIR